METDRLYNDPDLAQFYDIENEWSDSFEYCKHFVSGCSSLLDLGCGTGLFATAIAQNETCLVVGVDSAQPMLEIAARRPGGRKVCWIQADAKCLQLNQRFERIVLTGHAFQVFLNDQDQKAVLQMIATHLLPGGRFIFDSRNPTAEEWKKWTPTQSERLIKHSIYGDVLAWNDVQYDSTRNIVTYETCYKIIADNRYFTSQSQIAFPSQNQINSLIQDAGLYVDEWLGNWSGASYTRNSSEIIPIGRLA